MAKVYRVSDEKLLTDFDAVMTDGCTLPSWCVNELAPTLVTMNVPKGYFKNDDESLEVLSKLKCIGALVYNDGHIWTVDNKHHMELDSLKRPIGISDDFRVYLQSHPNRMYGYVFLLDHVKHALEFLQTMFKKFGITESDSTSEFEVILNRPLEGKSSDADRNFVLARWADRAIWIAQCLRAGYKHGSPHIRTFCDKTSKKIVSRYYLLNALNDFDFEIFTQGLVQSLIRLFQTDD